MTKLTKDKIKLIEKYGRLEIKGKEVIFDSNLVHNYIYVSQIRDSNPLDSIIDYIYKYIKRKLNVSVI